MSMRHHVIAAALVVAALGAQAQSASAPAPSSPAKKELITKIIALQQPALTEIARSVSLQPLQQIVSSADAILQQRIAPEKREAAAAQIRASVEKYRSETEPLVRERAVRVGQASLTAMFEEKYTEDELRQLLAAIDLPVFKKFQQGAPEFSNAFVQKLLPELRTVLDPRLKQLDQSISQTLGLPSAPAGASSGQGPRSTAPAASRPAAKK